MTRIQNFNFIIGKFPQMPKLLYNVSNIFWGGKCPKCPPWLRAWVRVLHISDKAIIFHKGGNILTIISKNYAQRFICNLGYLNDTLLQIRKFTF